MRFNLFAGMLALILVAQSAQAAAWYEKLGFGRKAGSQAGALAELSADQVSQGLKEALSKGIGEAVQLLGKENGFLTNADVRIRMPESLQNVERGLRLVRQDRLADEFVATLNRAAERAVPEATGVLLQSLQQMTLADAKAILQSTNNAATQYFRRTSETNLFSRFYPIVQKATADVGLTGAYKQMMGKVSFASTLFGQEATDLDGYVTQKTLDGLFLRIEDEEKKIRTNPAARTTELLEKVFAAVKPRG